MTLVEGMGEVLPPFGGSLSRYAKEALSVASVPLLGTFVTDIDGGIVTVKGRDGFTRQIAAETVGLVGRCAGRHLREGSRQGDRM